MKRTLSSVLLLALLGLAIGCGEDRNEVEISGRVTVDGQPIPNGSINFIASDGATPSGGGPIKDGAYVAKVPPGEKAVIVQGNKPAGQMKLYDTPDSPTIEKVEPITPVDYNNPTTTSLKASITGPQTDLNFDLDSKFKAQ